MVIDFHAHTFPNQMAEKTIQKLKEASHTKPFTNGTDTGLINSMKEAGIDRSVVLPVATNPLKVSHINDVSIAKNGQKGLIYFGCMHPDCPNVKSELLRIKDAGIKGIKLHPVYQDVDFDDRRNVEIVYCAEELGLITVTHAGLDIGFPGALRCTPQMIKNVISDVGPKRLVLAHMGGWRIWEEAKTLLAGTDVYIDTAFSLGKMTQEESYYSDEELTLLTNEEFIQLKEAFGEDNVLFGTDSPWGEQKETLRRVVSAGLEMEEKEKILYKNAQKLLGG